MRHALLFLFLASLFLGIVIAVMVFIRQKKQKNRLLLLAFIYSLILLLKISADNLAVYFWVNMPAESIGALFTFFTYISTLIVSFLLVFYTPFYLHDLLNPVWKRIANSIIIILALLSAVILLFPYILLFINPDFPNQISVEPLFRFIYFLVFGYILVLCGLFFRQAASRKMLFPVLICSYIVFGWMDIFFLKKMVTFGSYPSGLQWDLILFILWNASAVLEMKKSPNQQTVLETALPGELISRFEISSREKEILPMLLIGKNNREIANELFISEKTVKNHVYHIYQKLAVKNRVELIQAVMQFKKSK